MNTDKIDQIKKVIWLKALNNLNILFDFDLINIEFKKSYGINKNEFIEFCEYLK